MNRMGAVICKLFSRGRKLGSFSGFDEIIAEAELTKYI